MGSKITRFEDMTVWQESQELAVAVYKITENFPKSEMYSLSNQLRRAASSISANIAEGFGKSTDKDKSNFYHIALGSLYETKNFIYLAGKLDYVKQTDCDRIITTIDSVNKQINAILKYFNDK